MGFTKLHLLWDICTFFQQQQNIYLLGSSWPDELVSMIQIFFTGQHKMHISNSIRFQSYVQTQNIHQTHSVETPGRRMKAAEVKGK